MGNQLLQNTKTITVADAVTSLPSPPTSVADVQRWAGTPYTVPEFDIQFWAADAVDLSDTELFGAFQIPRTFASADADSLTNGSNEIDKVAHGFVTGDGPIRVSQATLPAELAADTDYWVIRVNDDNFQLASSLENAVEGSGVTFTDDGTGTFSYVGAGDSDASYSLRWASYGDLGKAADGAISLTASKGYSTRVSHRPNTVLYAVEATLSATVAVTVEIIAIRTT